jgi:hypothetical protein
MARKRYKRNNETSFITELLQVASSMKLYIDAFRCARSFLCNRRVLGYLDFRKALLKGKIANSSCLVGTMLQETYGTNPDISAKRKGKEKP